MGAPKPWPTRWPEPERIPGDVEWEIPSEDLPDPDYVIEIEPGETPVRLPEERWRPYAVTWAVTRACNLRCWHCYDARRPLRADLTTAQACAVIDRLADMGVTLIAFSGGEPLTRPDLFALLAYTRAQRIEIAMRSNATLITPRVARRLADLGVCVVGVSLDGADRATHDAVRGAGAYRRLRAGIDALLTAGIRVNVEVVLSRYNAAQALDLVLLAERWGVDEINFSALSLQGRARQLHAAALDPVTARRLAAQLREMSEIARVAVSPSCAFVGPCAACIEPNITCDGWVTPCYLNARPLFHLLEVTPAEAHERLLQARYAALNGCGRVLAHGPRASLAMVMENESV